MQAKRDENRTTVGLAYDGDSTAPIKLDPVTDALLVEIADTSSGGTITDTDRAKRDENYVPVLMAVTDDENENLVPIATDNDGNLLVDFR
jgi:hypothetical protein